MSTLIRLFLVAGLLAGFAFEAVAADKPDDSPLEAKKPHPPILRDKNLETVIRKELHKTAESGEITKADLKNVYFLRARGKNIADLSGLEHCTNLREIVLEENSIADVSALAGLVDVQFLNLAKNQISDVAPIANLKKLQYLKLDQNQLTKIDAVRELEALTSIYLAGNKVESIEPLTSLKKLQMLDLSENGLKDISPLSGLEWLSSLNLDGNGLSDLAPLAGLTELRFTMIRNNDVKDLSVLVSMAKKDGEGEKRFAPYWRLYLKGNPFDQAKTDAQVAELKKHNVRISMD